MTITFDLLQTVALAALLFLLGGAIKRRVKVFQTYFIPDPVIGGLLFSLLVLEQVGLKLN